MNQVEGRLEVLKRDAVEVQQWIESLPQGDFERLCAKYINEFTPSLKDNATYAARYMMLREQGTEPVWAEMSACRQSAGAKGTDRAFNEHANKRMSTEAFDFGGLIIDRAKKAGISTAGKYYCSGLADKRGAGDPGAWVSTTDDILAIARQRNLTVKGHVNHQGTVMPAHKEVLAADIVEDLAAKELHENPERAKQCRKSKQAMDYLRAEIKERYGRRKSDMQ